MFIKISLNRQKCFPLGKLNMLECVDWCPFCRPLKLNWKTIFRDAEFTVSGGADGADGHDCGNEDAVQDTRD